MGRATRGVLPAALAAGVTLAHLLMAAFMRAPIVMPDEGGYLENARLLARGGPRPVTNYYPGLSVLIAPVWRFTLDALTVWRWTLVVNSVAAGLTALLVWILVGCLSPRPLSRWWRAGIAVAVSTYPALLLYSNLAMAESLFALVATLAVLLMWWAPQRGPGAWFAVGITAGLLVAVHPRGAAVTIAAAVVGAVAMRPWERKPARMITFTALLVGLTLGAGITRVLVVATRPAAGTGIGAYSADAVVGRVVAAKSLSGVVVAVGGEVLYLTVATAGLAPFGVVLGLTELVALARGTRRGPAVIARAFAALSSLGILGMSSLFLNGGDRADHLIYGRYNEGAIAAPLVMAITWLVAASPGTVRRRRCMGLLVTGAAAISVGAVTLEFGVNADRLRAILNPATVLTLDPLLRRATNGLDPTTLLAIGAIAVGTIVLLMVRAPAVAVGVLAAAFLAVSIDNYAGYLVPGSTARARQDVLASTLNAANARLGIPRSCVGYDATDDFTYFNDRFYLAGWQVDLFNSAVSPPPCGPFVISDSPDFYGSHPGTRLVSIENDVVSNLYVLPGPVSRKLQAAGWLLPPQPAPLPTGQQAVLSVSGRPVSVHQGTTATVRVTTRNVGSASAWPNLRALKTDQYVVRVAARWFPTGERPAPPGKEGPVPVAASFAELPRPLLPGELANIRVVLAPKTPGGLTLRPGRYLVQVAVYQELVGTIPGGVLTFPITVVP